LQDCVQMALQHNLDLQIDRYTPQIAQFDLRGAYGGYDPVLSLSGDHGQSDSNPTLLGTTLIPGQKRTTTPSMRESAAAGAMETHSCHGE